MAEARKTEGYLTYVKPKIVLELTEDEAHFLGDILGNIAGSSRETRRGLQSNISEALRTVIGETGQFREGYPKDIKGYIQMLKPGEQ